MVTFNELRICEDGNYLVVDCEVENVDLYAGMYIKSIYLEYYKNATSSMPGSKAYKLYENTYDDTRVKGKRVLFKAAELGNTDFGITSFEGEMFYVIVQCDGSPASEIATLPCGFDDTTDIGAIIDWKTFYDKAMNYVSLMFGPCGDPCADIGAFEHFILLWNALKLAIETCDWETVKDLWDKFKFAPVPKGSSGNVVTSGCGCGR